MTNEQTRLGKILDAIRADSELKQKLEDAPSQAIQNGIFEKHGFSRLSKEEIRELNEILLTEPMELSDEDLEYVVGGASELSEWATALAIGLGVAAAAAF